MLSIILQGVLGRISKLGEAFSSEVLFCSFMVTADDELVDTLYDAPTNLKAKRSVNGIAIEGLTERTIDSMHVADDVCSVVAEKRRSSVHIRSHSVSFIKIYIENFVLKTQRTVFLSFVDLGCPKTMDISETTRAADLRRAQRVQRSLSSLSDTLIGLQRFQVAPPTSSMLTFVLQDFWNSESLIQMLFWMSNDSGDLNDCIESAEFAASCRLRTIICRAVFLTCL